MYSNLETTTGSVNVTFPSKAYELKYLQVENVQAMTRAWYAPIDIGLSIPETRRKYSIHRPVPTGMRDRSDISSARKTQM